MGGSENSENRGGSLPQVDGIPRGCRVLLTELPLLCITDAFSRVHHEGDEAAVAAAPALLLVARPHDLNARDRPEAPKLALEHLLVHIRRQIAHIPAGPGRSASLLDVAEEAIHAAHYHAAALAMDALHCTILESSSLHLPSERLRHDGERQKALHRKTLVHS